MDSAASAVAKAKPVKPDDAAKVRHAATMASAPPAMVARRPMRSASAPVGTSVRMTTAQYTVLRSMYSTRDRPRIQAKACEMGTHR